MTTMNPQPVHTNHAPQPAGPYSQAVQVGQTLYLSGQIGIDMASGQLADSFAAQAEAVFDHLASVCRAAGGDLQNIVKLNIYVLDLANFPEVNRIMEERFADPQRRPARATIAVRALPLGADVEMEAIAVLP